MRGRGRKRQVMDVGGQSAKRGPERTKRSLRKVSGRTGGGGCWGVCDKRQAASARVERRSATPPNAMPVQRGRLSSTPTFFLLPFFARAAYLVAD